jgi:hypothetical protein
MGAQHPAGAADTLVGHLSYPVKKSLIRTVIHQPPARGLPRQVAARRNREAGHSRSSSGASHGGERRGVSGQTVYRHSRGPHREFRQYRLWHLRWRRRDAGVGRHETGPVGIGWRIAMNMKIIIAAATISCLGAGKVFAFGYPGMQPSVFAAHAFPNEPYHTGTVFSEIFCHQARSGPAASRTATSTTAGDSLPRTASTPGQSRSFAASHAP